MNEVLYCVFCKIVQSIIKDILNERQRETRKKKHLSEISFLINNYKETIYSDIYI